jgi:hypothetical protein
MRRILVGVLLAGAAGGGVILSGVVAASASGPTMQCNSTLPSTPLGSTQIDQPGGANTSGEIQVCETGSPIVDGTVTAEGNANPPGGYLVADGSGSPGHATGYIGVEGGTSGANVVGCSQGDYDNGSSTNPANLDGTSSTGQPEQAPGPNDGTGTTDANGNNVIVGTSGNSLAETATGKCSVTNEPAP